MTPLTTQAAFTCGAGHTADLTHTLLSKRPVMIIIASLYDMWT